MKKLIVGTLLGGLLITSGTTLAADYKFDKQGQHAFVNFRIQHLGYSWVYGTFRNFDGDFTYDEKDPAKNAVNVTIDTSSVDSNHAERDKHIRSNSILNVDKYPKATFTSTAVTTEKDGKMSVVGDLTLNGVTRPITLAVELHGKGKDPWGNERAGFDASGKIVMKDFNIKQDLGPASQEVELIISVEGIRK